MGQYHSCCKPHRKGNKKAAPTSVREIRTKRPKGRNNEPLTKRGNGKQKDYGAISSTDEYVTGALQRPNGSTATTRNSSEGLDDASEAPTTLQGDAEELYRLPQSSNPARAKNQENADTLQVSSTVSMAGDFEKLREKIFLFLETHRKNKCIKDKGIKDENIRYNGIENQVSEDEDLDEENPQNEDSKDEGVILPEEVKSVWGPIYYRRFYTTQSWYDESWDKSNKMDDYLCVMSILIYIHFRDWKDFRRLFIDPELQDKHLPFDLKQLREPGLLGHAFGTSFYKDQWKFCPIVIQEREDPYKTDGPRLLPWLDEPMFIAEGGYGRVTKRTIAKRYLEYDNKAVNPKPKAVAIKCIIAKDVQPVEFENLKALRRCLSGHKRIMVNLATLVEDSKGVGKIYHIVYELAAYDLNVFLTTLPVKLRDKRLESAPPERNCSSSMGPGDLILESRNLADALDYLHSRLYSAAQISLAHNDIKPENVLVFYPDSTDKLDRYPVGKWKIADFGLSRVKDKHQSGNEYLSAASAAPAPRKAADITHRIEVSVSKTEPKRDPGRYTAPELDQKIIQKTDGRKADIWSFGCVLSEVIAYAVRLDPKLVEDFRCALSESSPDQRFYDVKTKEVKRTFFTYLNTLPQKTSTNSRKLGRTQWVSLSVDLMGKIVVANPKERMGADKIRDALRDINKSWLDDSLHVDTSVNDMGGSYSPGLANASAMESPEELSLQTDGRSDAFSRTPEIRIGDAPHTFSLYQ